MYVDDIFFYHRVIFTANTLTGNVWVSNKSIVQVFRKADFEVDLVSETGTYAPDWLSTTEDWLPATDRAVYEDHNSEFRRKLDHLLKPADIEWARYGLFFASAGHASLIDYPDATGLQGLASEIYGAGKGIMSAVCHGGAIFPGVLDKETGKSVIDGKRVTGFTTKGVSCSRMSWICLRGNSPIHRFS